ncbi:hypothetical protein [Mesorhizobium silamurunense]|uniref:hypothetical protein n=1 Tax=Mesorhizobium silamurunense TaxID=499528 RepID=UPI0017802438|nr:hypothetical protein [Mesorhizobium silamurunense]
MTIVPETVFNWAVVASIVLSLPIGAALVGGTFLRMLRVPVPTIVLATGLFAFATLGVVLLTTPKWTQLALKFSGFEATISKLENENGTIRTQLAAAQVNQITNYVADGKVWKPAEQRAVEDLFKAALVSVPPSASPDQASRAFFQSLQAAGISTFRTTNELPADPKLYGTILLEGMTPSGWRELADHGAVDAIYQKGTK